MNFPNRHSITWKLFWLAARVIGFAVLVAAGAFVWQEVRVLHDTRVQQVQAVAQVLASNCAVAVSFDQRDAAQDLLSSLRHQPMVLDAYIIDGEGRRFAGYVAKGRSDIEPMSRSIAGPEVFGFTPEGHLEVRSPILEDGETLGSLLVHARMDDVVASMWSHVPTSLAVLFLSLLVGLALALHLQRSITYPILRLTTTAQEISQSGNYQLRVDVDEEGEIGFLCEQFNRMVRFVDEANQELNRAHEQVVKANDLLEERVKERTFELAEANNRLLCEIEERKKAHRELQELQEQLVRTSRQAGMAELANGMLHNIGNVLNSVNVTASMLAEKIVDMKTSSLRKVVELLESKAQELGPFFINDEKGLHVIPFLSKLADHFETAQEKAAAEITALKKYVHHIESIVQSQQSFAGSYGLMEHCESTAVFEDAVKFVGGSFDRHRINILRDYEEGIMLEIDKGKLLQILVNFIRNAKDALVESNQTVKTITLRFVRQSADRVEFHVADNGIGISESNLKHIFAHGFTTKKKGHGFGLHSAAIAAREIGGAVSVHSDGPGKGATFCVAVPLSPPPTGLGITSPYISAIPQAIPLH